METMEPEPIVCGDGTRRPIGKNGKEAIRFEARRVAGANGTSTNYPRDLTEMADRTNFHRADFRYRRRVREHIEGARLTNSRVGLFDYERYELDKANDDARVDRVEANRATREAKRQKRLERMAGRN